jgi:hypothetical protein
MGHGRCDSGAEVQMIIDQVQAVIDSKWAAAAAQR